MEAPNAVAGGQKLLPNMNLIHNSFRTTILYAQLLLCYTVLSLLRDHKATATCVHMLNSPFSVQHMMTRIHCKFVGLTADHVSLCYSYIVIDISVAVMVIVPYIRGSLVDLYYTVSIKSYDLNMKTQAGHTAED